MSAQSITTFGGVPAKKVAQFNDNRACTYYLVKNPDFEDTSYEYAWVLIKVSNRGSSVMPVCNPYDIDGLEYGAIKDAKLIGDNLYVINTSYREGDNLACLNTRTGKWSNPIQQCAQCKFIGNNKIWVKSAQLISSGESRADNRYRFSEKTMVLR